MWHSYNSQDYRNDLGKEKVMSSSTSKKKRKPFREFLTKLGYQADKPFYAWALIWGPKWAQNVTFVALWIYIPLIAVYLLSQMIGVEKSIDRAKEDKEWGKDYLSKCGSGLWALPSFIVAGTLAAEGWFATAFFFSILILTSCCVRLFERDGIREAISDNQDQD
jgi:hypothetical protein